MDNRLEINNLQEVDETACALVTRQAGRPRACDVEARMHNLLHTAGRLILEKGYAKVSLEMVAREAHVAVRTIYVKFGGKAGLLHAVMLHNRERFFSDETEMERDQRPVPEVLADFAQRFWKLVTAPEARQLQRVVIAEAKSSPDLAEAFFNAGPCLTREMLRRYFARPDVRAQLHPAADLEQLPGLLINCVIGDAIHHFLFDSPPPVFDDDQQQALQRRLDLFLRGALK
ncbi:MAG TPA: TetR/AcrR family transcriptional regulator [Telluria sp.]|nr:TetR/AcrR family transcriptional regulator [Telluria sp.]